MLKLQSLEMILRLVVWLLLLVLSTLSFSAGEAPVFQHVEEWHSWKNTHDKSYTSQVEELEKHLVWLSNKALVEQHNVNAELGFYSYKLKLNHFADMVSG